MIDAGPARLEVSPREHGLSIVVPHLPENTAPEDWFAIQQELLATLLHDYAIQQYVLWYYTPMAMEFTRDLTPLSVVYDCMDELSAFASAPPELRRCEVELLTQADLVFTGGVSLYEAKRDRHPRVYPFPSSVDVAHFASARSVADEPADQAAIPHPRLGFFGVLDERMDRDLLAGVADARPDWQLVVIGPIAKIDPADLPQRANIHYLGSKPYAELPQYLAGWDVALMPFARNEATQFISPTKTPEYLAAGRPVVSTSIRDVVRPYGEQALVRIADTVPEFVDAIEAALTDQDRETWLQQVDAHLASMSWDHTWREMYDLILDRMPLQSLAVGAPAVDTSR